MKKVELYSCKDTLEAYYYALAIEGFTNSINQFLDANTSATLEDLFVFLDSYQKCLDRAKLVYINPHKQIRTETYNQARYGKNRDEDIDEDEIEFSQFEVEAKNINSACYSLKEYINSGYNKNNFLTQITNLNINRKIPLNQQTDATTKLFNILDNESKKAIQLFREKAKQQNVTDTQSKPGKIFKCATDINFSIKSLFSVKQEENKLVLYQHSPNGNGTRMIVYTLPEQEQPSQTEKD